MSQLKGSGSDGEETFATLRNNAQAVQAICAAVEGTLGPKGLDTMLVGSAGDVIITNDGVTILEKMDVAHPAAQLLIQVARSQQERIGDGTTTATVLAGALVAEGARQVMRGVPVAKVVRGVEEGIARAVGSLSGRARPLAGLDDPMLLRIAHIAAREHGELAALIVAGARRLGPAKLREETFRFADVVQALGKSPGEVWPGLVLAKRPVNAQPEELAAAAAAHVLVVQDAFGPAEVEDEALTTDAGFQRQLLLREQFRDALMRLSELRVGLVVADRAIDPEAEQYCSDHGIMVLQRLPRAELRRLCAYTGARPVRRAALYRPAAELAAYIGYAGHIAYDERLRCIRIAEGRGPAQVSVIVGASTDEIAGERLRIAKDAASSVQAALIGGWLPGGGAAELAAAHELERYRETVRGMEGFGLEAVAQALRKPLAQIVVNAGYNPLEKVEEAKAAQVVAGADSLGIDCDTGAVADMAELGVIDPAPVKLHALQAAGEVACAVLRIHTVIKMRGLREQE
ncbi:TCP-1/cpn60 chaperonin family protein [Paenibacillus sp. YYML68]|uniref:TCP-1/cpn60 chaperonin family protein n=1 Tax=Paenibacillus sp. YYML68 TaxID=2909250 RepID=UPI0024922733|nr:TCP-1/cpn60 chaperonin family protein [Paenibacillus sp. YYML68]